AAIALGLGFSLVLGGVAAGWWNARYAGGGAPLGLAGWQFAFLVASAPGVILCTLLWRLQEPVRGSIDGLPAPNDPAPFRASLSLFGAVVPGGNWLAMIHAKAGARDWLGTVLYTGGVIALCALLAHICARFSPRPPLALFGGHINPHVLQWSVVGFGLLVIGNLVQSMKRTDPVMHMLLTRSRGLQLSVLVGSLQTLINYGVMGFTPSFLIRTFHLPPPVVGLHFGLLAAGLGVLGPLVAGPLSDRLAHNWSATGRVSLVLFSLSLSPLIAILVYQAPTIDAFYSRFVIYSLVLTMWLPPLYAVMYEQVLPRQRALFGSIYLVILTILGLGIGPYWVGMVADARHGELGGAILSVMWVAPVIVAALVWLLWAAPRDEALLLERARAAGEPV
ncbi:MAG: MFS transporter, partial [Alphaproteobacteria bacterium]|nr:MFS transporter [Alphaproteobacteria bacterium]